MKILFWLNKGKSNSFGEAPLMMRLTQNGIRKNLTLDTKVKAESWDRKKQRVKGTSETVLKINNLIQSYQNRAIDALNKVVRESENYSLQDIIARFRGADADDTGFVEMFELHIKNMEARVGLDFAPATIKKYRHSMKNLSHFLEKKIGKKDIPLRLITRNTVAELDQFLRGELRFNNNHVNKTVEQIRRVFKSAIVRGIVVANPFDLVTFKRTDTHRDFLSKEELRLLLSYNTINKRLQETRDVFVFMCLTGLAHTDAKKATLQDVSIGADGNPWLMLRRTKTKTQITVPILPILSDLLKKYSHHTKCTKNNLLLPVPCNQVLNRALKLLMAELKIRKNICTHSARYTFASTVLLSNGIRVEVAQRLLAHNSIKSTMLYGKLSESALVADVNQLNVELEKLIR